MINDSQLSLQFYSNINSNMFFCWICYTGSTRDWRRKKIISWAAFEKYVTLILAFLKPPSPGTLFLYEELFFFVLAVKNHWPPLKRDVLFERCLNTEENSKAKVLLKILICGFKWNRSFESSREMESCWDRVYNETRRCEFLIESLDSRESHKF